MSVVVLAGATGDLGFRIAKALVARGAEVRATHRHGASEARVEALRKLGAEPVAVNFDKAEDMLKACVGASCVVSALSGLRDVIVEAQTVLVDAAMLAGVPRFIPSDFSLNYTKLDPGANRNFDLRREFREELGKSSIRATSIFNAAFAEMLTGPAPILLFKFRRVLYWGDADQKMDFTTMDDTAAFTAYAALDDAAPRNLEISGDRVSARELCQAMSEIDGRPWQLLQGGDLERLRKIETTVRRFSPKTKSIYPVWQGMQYLHNMFEGKALPPQLDNSRYPVSFTKIRPFLAAYRQS